MAKAGGWQLAESGPEAYEQYLVPALFAPWAERLIDCVDLQKGDRVLDVGCGTGIVARYAAGVVGDDGTVVGLDVNEGMLEVARATSTEVTSAVEWRRGDATDLPFTDGTFDVVLCQQALQFVADPSAALREMRRVLAPDGRMAISVLRPLAFNPGYGVLAGALERHVGDDAGAMMRSPFPDWEGEMLRALADDAGFRDRAVTIEISAVRYPSIEEFVRREAASSPLAGPLGSLDRDVRGTLIREIEDALGEYVDDDGIVIPLESYVLVAHR